MALQTMRVVVCCGLDGSVGAGHVADIATERGGFVYIADMAVRGPGDIWSVGESALIHYDGVNWRTVASFSPENEVEWTAIDVRNDWGWAVDDGCGVLRIESGAYQYQRLGEDCGLLDVAVTTAGDAWAVGYREIGRTRTIPLILHNDGVGWGEVDCPYADGAADSVLMLSDASGWISTGGGFLRFAGGVWSHVPRPAGRGTIYDMSGVEEDDIWAVGGWYGMTVGDAGHRSIWHYDGERWDLVEEGEVGPLLDVSVPGDGPAWAVGSGGRILRLEAGRWEQFDSVGLELSAIGYVAEDDVWFGGDLQVLHYDGRGLSPWASETRLGGQEGISSISVVSGGRGWAAGWGGPLLQRQGGQWREVHGIPHDGWAWKVAAASTGDVWVSYKVSSPPGVVAHFDGMLWTEIALPTPYRVWDFSVLDRTSVWAVACIAADEGHEAAADILHYDGSSWRIVHSLVGEAVSAIDMITDQEGWAVGSRLLHYHDGTWFETTTPGGEPLVAISFLDANHGWAVAMNYAAEYRDGEWIVHDVDAEYSLEAHWSVAVAPTGEPWIAGDGRMLHYDGAKWESVELPVAYWSANQMRSVAIQGDADGYEVWVSGRHENIVRVSVGSVLEPTPTRQQECTYLPKVGKAH
jgi:hypothetical protein